MNTLRGVPAQYMSTRLAKEVLTVCPLCSIEGPTARLSEHLREDHVHGYLRRLADAPRARA